LSVVNVTDVTVSDPSLSSLLESGMVTLAVGLELRTMLKVV